MDFNETLKVLNGINKAVYGVEPFKVEEEECCDTFMCPHEFDEPEEPEL